MPYYFGFRQVRIKTTEGIVLDPGRAVLCGPYPTWEAAENNRANSRAFDAALSFVFLPTRRKKPSSVSSAIRRWHRKENYRVMHRPINRICG